MKTINKILIASLAAFSLAGSTVPVVFDCVIIQALSIHQYCNAISKGATI